MKPAASARMTSTTEIVDRYTAVWNEPDDEIRGKVVTALWAEDAVHTIEEAVFRGRSAIEERVAHAFGEFVASAGFVFRAVGHPLEHHGAVKLSWEMVPATGGQAAATGFAFLLLNGDGLIQNDYQFTEAPPVATQ